MKADTACEVTENVTASEATEPSGAMAGRSVTRRDFLIRAARAPAAWPLVAPALYPFSLSAFQPAAAARRAGR